MAARRVVALLVAVPCLHALEMYVTLRDFLPAQCMRYSEYMEAWNVTGKDPGNYFIKDVEWDAWSTKADIGATTKRFYDRFRKEAPPGGRTDIAVTDLCPYWENLKAGEISGHPDFEADDADYRVGPICSVDFDENCPVSEFNLTAMADMSTTLDTSGLRTIQYCMSGEDDRCGRVRDGPDNLAAATTKKYFDLWYSDRSNGPQYSKRVGTKLTLTEDSNTPGKYVYDSNGRFFPISDKFGDGSTIETDYTDWRHAPVWPNSIRNINDNRKVYKFWFTSEIHTYFRYRGDEVFTFTGDDDVWVFINDQLAVDLGGLHSPRTGSVDLSLGSPAATALGLQVNQTYRFDMFHAERKFYGSNFRFETTLVAGCNVAGGSGSRTFNQATDLGGTVAKGISSTNAVTGELQVTSRASSDPDNGGSIWIANQQNVGAGFVAEFTFTVGQQGQSHGMAFVLHNDPNGIANLPRTTGQNLNWRYIRNSVAVIFDLCSNNDFANGCSQEISVHFSKDESTQDNRPGDDTKVVSSPVVRPLNLGDEHVVRIEYLNDPDWVQVFLDESLYLRVENFDLQSTLGGRNAFIGFTSASSADPADITVSGLSVETVEIDGTESFFTQEETAIIVADGVSTAPALTLKTNDGCGDPIQFGGYAELGAALLVEEPQPDGSYYNGSAVPQIVQIPLSDRNDGSYTADFTSLIVANYTAYACFGMINDPCTLEHQTNNDGTVTVGVADPGHRFSGAFPRSIMSVEQTPAPTFAPVAASDAGGLSSETVLTATVAGGSAGAFLLLAVAMYIIQRRKWNRSKGFISDGRMHRLEDGVKYDKEDEYSTLGAKVLESRAAILQMEAKNPLNPEVATISKLEAEQNQLSNELRALKTKARRKTNRVSAFFG